MAIKALDPDWIQIGIQPKMLDPDPYQINANPQPYYLMLLMYFDFYVFPPYLVSVMRRKLLKQIQHAPIGHLTFHNQKKFWTLHTAAGRSWSLWPLWRISWGTNWRTTSRGWKTWPASRTRDHRWVLNSQVRKGEGLWKYLAKSVASQTPTLC